MPADNRIYDAPGDIWWDEDQPLSAIRTALNPGRLDYLHQVLEHRRVNPGQSRALDVGCGGGLFAEELAKLGFQVTGVDPSGPSLATARAHAARSGLEIRYQAGSGESLPLPDGSFQLAVCWDVLEHVSDLEPVISETSRVLAPGGVYVYDTINRTLRSRLAVIGLLQEWRPTRLVPPGLHDWKQFIRPRELHAAMARHGLASRELRGLAPAANPLELLKLVRSRKRGQISFGDLGRRASVRLVGSTAILYIGHAVKAG